MFNSKNGRLTLGSKTMDYIRFGDGRKNLVMIPGVGDGLKTVKGTAMPFAWMYRALAHDFTVYAFSRVNELERPHSTRQMAQELDAALDQLGIEQACVMGVSQGGMIAQWLAIDHPKRVAKLALVVTAPCPNDTMLQAIGTWIDLAERGDYRAIMLDTAERSYSPARIRQARRMYSVLGNVGKPKGFERFLIQVRSCLDHDASEELHRIACPTLVIGGTDDRILTGEASEELANAIPESQLYLYDGLGHGLYEEAEDFLDRVSAFFE